MNQNINNDQAEISLINEINDKIWSQRGTIASDFDPVKLCQEALEKSKAINYTYGIGRCTLSMGMGAFILQHNNELAINLLNDALTVFKELNEKRWMANTLLTIGIVNNSIGKPEAALYYASKGIEYYETNTKDEPDAIMAYYVIGTVYKDLKKFDEAEKYYTTGLTFESRNSWGGRIYTSLSNIYNDRSQFEKALELALKSLQILRDEKNEIGESRALSDIGIIYKKLKKYDHALDYLFQGLKIREKINLKHFILGSLLEIATIYKEQENYNEALLYFLKAEPLANETNHQSRLTVVYQNIATLYKLILNYSKSLEYYEKYMQLVIELNSKEREIKINDLQSSLLQDKEQEIERLKNVELKNAYNLITEKNKEITDSIQYAKRIQKALMASDNMLNKNLNEHFILYKPKAIVSGDFYWAAEMQNGNFAIITADSTGHGVPGAFMSLLSISFLNESINANGLTNPAQILDYTRSRLIQSLAEDGSTEGGKDGMDCILCVIDFKNLKLNYAAANNSFYIIREGQIINCSANKMPVGKSPKENESFTLNIIDLKKGDIIYTLTDGFPDQFGGPKGKKFRHKHLEECLLGCSNLPMDKQYEILNQKFEEWKGNLEQIDDVLLIGIKI